jgi:dTDP-4-dehydrorhamnose reductase
VPLIRFWTDYVIDGSGETPWREGHQPRQLSSYGRSKRDGEKAIQASGAAATQLPSSPIVSRRHTGSSIS